MAFLSDYQLYLFDVDNTLTNTKREISQRTIAAITALSQRGIQVGLCTGRTSPSIRKKVLPFFPKDSLHVVSGGAQLITSQERVLWEKCIPHKAAFDLVERAAECNAGFLLTQDGKLYGSQPMIEYLAPLSHHQGIVTHHYTELTDYTTPIMPVFNASLEFFNYINERKDITCKQMQTYEHRNADITAAGVNKATGIYQLSQYTGIPIEKMVGFGDSENDLEFLSTVGLSIAMGNATAHIKTLARRVIGHADDDGLAIYIEHILDGGEL